MSGRNRRKRGSGGHPAKVAARRQRDQQRRRGGSDEDRALARELARSGDEISSALEAEGWISELLGLFRSMRYGLPMQEAVGLDPELLYGQTVVRELAKISSPGAAIALMAIAEVAQGELATLAMELLDSSGGYARLPRWAADIGEATIIAAAEMSERVFDDGRTLFLEAHYPDGETIAVGVLIDNNLGGMAKDVLLANTIAHVTDAMKAHDDANLELKTLDPVVASGLILDAFERTDVTWDPPVSDDYWSGYTHARLLAGRVSDPVTPEPRPELSQPAREALRDEFLSSPEADGFAPDGDAAWTAVLAIDFCADYVDGDPLRWSPVVVELFMADWIPRKVMTTETLLAVLPKALDAWVRFAARKRGTPDWALQHTRDAISDWREEMTSAANDPTLAGPSKQLFLAAQSAGVDIADTKALDTFVAGWNARSMLEAEDQDLDDEDLMPATADKILQLKITLKGLSKPPVWRRLLVEIDTPLDRLHEIIQTAFGWEDCHLHAFEVAGQQFAQPDRDLELDCLDERDFSVGELIAAADNNKVRYRYDFGDGWVHELEPEDLLERSPESRYPELVRAKGACPPEDCGGIWGYERLKQVMADPDADEHMQLLDWLGIESAESFDPKAVDAAEIKRRLKRLAAAAD